MSPNQWIQTAKEGFSTIKVNHSYKQLALTNLEQWLTGAEFSAYQPQLVHMLDSGFWEYLLDCFYQVIPFGTGGRRGEVGIGPNRINAWTIQSSAQGHSQFLLKKYGDEAKKRGIVLAYDVRQFYGNKFMDDSLPNPVKDLTGKMLAEAAAEVYTANGILTYMFDGFRTTPELSFAIRYLHTVSGDVFSASHNPPEHNGKKVYDETGGQLTPPYDEELVNEVTKNALGIKQLSYTEAQNLGLVKVLGSDVDDAYINAGAKLSLSSARKIVVAYTPLHGCGSTSVQKVLEKLGFDVQVDPATANPSGRFEHVTFNIPNPEVEQSFDQPKKFAEKIHADLLLSSDPDADRIGLMVRHQDKLQFLNGNQIGAILTRYVIQKKAGKLSGQGMVIETQVTTGLITKIAEANRVRVINDLLVGFKYIGEEMNRLEKEGEIENFLFGAEESHSYLAGNYVRDKDAVVAAVWLSELGAELKVQGKTLIDYLQETYVQYGYFCNYLTEIRLPGAEGMTQIQEIQKGLREHPPTNFGRFEVASLDDWQTRLPIVSETDRVAKNGLSFIFKPVAGTASIRVTVRPSGTEPKIKMYYEIGAPPCTAETLVQVQADMESIREELEKAFMLVCYRLIGVDFPERGFLLFWQLPLQDKLHYLEIEPQLAALREVTDVTQKQQQFAKLTAFLGSDPVQKIDPAFMALYHQGVREYIGL